MKLRHLQWTALLAALPLLPLLACSRVSPVAPSGSTITLSANPSFIATPTGTSTITAIVLRPSGQPALNGTVVRFTVDIGTIDPEATTNSNGVATAILHADGQLGKATVSAFVGATATATTLPVTIGSTPLGAFINLQADPPSVSPDGGNIKLEAVIRDQSGNPVPGAGVTFSSPVGKLRSGGGIVLTNSSGLAIDTLTVTAADLTNIAGTFSVSATAIGSSGALNATFAIGLNNGQPVAAFTFSQVGSLTVQFIDQSTPSSGLTENWEFGDDSSSQEQNPTHTYAAAGQYTVILTVTNNTGQSSTATHQVTVTAPSRAQH